MVCSLALLEVVDGFDEAALVGEDGGAFLHELCVVGVAHAVAQRLDGSLCVARLQVHIGELHAVVHVCGVCFDDVLEALYLSVDVAGFLLFHEPHFADVCDVLLYHLVVGVYLLQSLQQSVCLRLVALSAV